MEGCKWIVIGYNETFGATWRGVSLPSVLLKQENILFYEYKANLHYAILYYHSYELYYFRRFSKFIER